MKFRMYYMNQKIIEKRDNTQWDFILKEMKVNFNILVKIL